MKNISGLGKWALIFYPTLVILFAIPLELLAQTSPQFPDSENRGSPERTGGAGGRVKPDEPDSDSPIFPFPPSAPSSGGEFNRSKPRFLPRPASQDHKKKRLTFPLEEAIRKSNSNLGTVGSKAGGSCVTIDRKRPFLNSLIPPIEHIGTTAKNNPSVFVYLSKNTANMGEFLVMNEKEEEVYRTSLKLPATPGVIKLTIPETAKLENNKTYRWYFAVICDPIDRSADEYVGGEIKKIKIDPLLNRQLVNAKPLEQAKISAKNQIWYDTLDAISTVKKDHQVDWESLLNSVGLEKFAKEPLLDCCQPDSK
jgi:hypothetical protein